MSVSTPESTPVETVHDLLAGEDSTTWSNDPPQIAYQWEWSQSERQANATPTVYLWSPTPTSISTFSSDASYMIDESTVEANIWVLKNADERAVKVIQYQRDVIQILSQYLKDNGENTSFHSFEITNADDLRNESVATRTDHYVATVEVELQKLQPTR